MFRSHTEDQPRKKPALLKSSKCVFPLKMRALDDLQSNPKSEWPNFLRIKGEMWSSKGKITSFCLEQGVSTGVTLHLGGTGQCLRTGLAITT